MTTEEIDAKIDALRRQLLGAVERHRVAVAERVSNKSAPARHAGKRRATIEADLARYEAALRDKYGLRAAP